MSELAGFTPHRLRQLEREGWFAKKSRNLYDAIEVLTGIIRFQRDDARRSSKSATANTLQSARTREIELRIAREENILVEADDVVALHADIIGGFVSELRGVPAGSSRDPIVRAAIEEVLNGAIARCRDRLEKLSADLNSGRGVVFDGDETDAG